MAEVRFSDLRAETQEFLRGKSPEELKSLEYLSTIPVDELKAMRKFVLDVKANGRFLRWILLGSIALFLGGVTLGENILKVIKWFKGATQ